MSSLLWKKEYFDILAFQIRNTTFDFYPFTVKAPCDPKEENVIFFSVPPLHQLLSEGTDTQGTDRKRDGGEEQGQRERRWCREKSHPASAAAR